MEIGVKWCAESAVSALSYREIASGRGDTWFSNNEPPATDGAWALAQIDSVQGDFEHTVTDLFSVGLELPHPSLRLEWGTRPFSG